MSLDRRTVERLAAEHVRHLRRAGRVLTAEDRHALRRRHERLAIQAERRARGRR
jgi:hypothetical protein